MLTSIVDCHISPGNEDPSLENTAVIIVKAIV